MANDTLPTQDGVDAYFKELRGEPTSTRGGHRRVRDAGASRTALARPA